MIKMNISHFIGQFHMTTVKPGVNLNRLSRIQAVLLPTFLCIPRAYSFQHIPTDSIPTEYEWFSVKTAVNPGAKNILFMKIIALMTSDTRQQSSLMTAVCWQYFTQEKMKILLVLSCSRNGLLNKTEYWILSQFYEQKSTRFYPEQCRFSFLFVNIL